MSGRRETPDDAGVGRSYGELYVEYAPAARGLALSMVPPDVADDIVAEAFARVLAAIRAGGGPDHAFRPYLLAAVRNLANDWIAARRRVTVIGDLDEEADDRSAPLDLWVQRRCGDRGRSPRRGPPDRQGLLPVAEAVARGAVAAGGGG
jgi:DNA-directed RNA polymerase specialized sigma24 family protein